MDGLNSGVITGKCSGCVALRVMALTVERSELEGNCPFCGVYRAHKRLVCGDRVARLEGELVGYKNDLQNVREMKDAANERADENYCLHQELRHETYRAIQVAEQAQENHFRAIERAEAAERDAAEQRALARRQANGLQWAWYALIMAWQVPSPYYFYWMKLLNILISQTAEAQEEGDGD